MTQRRFINYQAIGRRAGLSAFLVIVCSWLVACGGAAPPPPTPTLDPVLVAGQKVFVAHCGACHSATGDTVIVGPPLAGIAARGAARVDGLDARAYVYSSIMQPGDYVVEGYQDLMPKDLAKKLTGEEMDSVVAYVLSLRGAGD